MSVKIKICGMTDAGNIESVMQLRPDYLGFIFYPLSPRHVVGKVTSATIQALSTQVVTTGVFVDQPLSDVTHIADGYGLKAVQLHGNESPEMCKKLKNSGLLVIKAFGVKSDNDLILCSRYADCVDFFLFDTKTQQHGGSGQSFDWNILKDKMFEKPFFISGGISPENIEAAAVTGCFGVDLNSQFEQMPGIKNVDSLKISLLKIRNKLI